MDMFSWGSFWGVTAGCGNGEADRLVKCLGMTWSGNILRLLPSIFFRALSLGMLMIGRHLILVHV